MPLILLNSTLNEHKKTTPGLAKLFLKDQVAEKVICHHNLNILFKQFF